MSFWHGRAVGQETNGPVEIGIEANAWASACKHDTSPHLDGTTLESAPATELRLLRLGAAAVSITDCSSAHNCSKVAVATAPEVAARNARQPDKRHLIMSDRKSATETPNGHATPSSGHPCILATSHPRQCLHNCTLRFQLIQLAVAGKRQLLPSRISCGFQVHVKGFRVLRLELCPLAPQHGISLSVP